jgi:hypothetical protein
MSILQSPGVSPLSILAAVLACPQLVGGRAAAAPPSPGQPGPQAVAAVDGRMKLALSLGFEHKFRGDLDGGGDYSASRFDLGVSARFTLSDVLELGIPLGYEFSGYDFEGATRFGFAADNDVPWRGIHTLSTGARLTWKVNEQWRVFGGPLVRLSGEADADAGESLSAGGMIGASCRISDTLILGGGVGVLSQIEDDLAYFPIIIVDWKITDTLRLVNAGSAAGTTISSRATGVELVWDINPKAELALGVAYDSRRFRLADDNPVAPDGVGEETNIPMWIRASYQVNDTLGVDAWGGLAFGGEVTLEDRGGNRIARDDAAATPIVGVALRLRF